MTRPVRLQLSRRKGFDLQAQSRAINGLPAVNVARPSKWGNPYQAGTDGEGDRAYLARLYRDYMDRQLAPETPRRETTVAALRELRGRNLACWCPPGPCHADVLLELANGPICEEVE